MDSRAEVRDGFRRLSTTPEGITEIFGILKRKELPFVKPAAIRGVRSQQAERRSAHRIAVESEDFVALEMLIPLIPPRMNKAQSCPGPISKY
jgi:hypothetical protein